MFVARASRPGRGGGTILVLLALVLCGRAAAQEYASAVVAPHEVFVPSMNVAPAAEIELREEATIVGREVKLKSVCRWNSSDAKFFAPVAELTIATVPVGKTFKPITMEQVRTAISGAGVNLGSVRFMGPLLCTITRSDSEVEKTEAFEQWAEAHQVQGALVAKTQASAVAIAAVVAAPVVQDAGVRALKDILTADLAQHLSLPIESLALQFNDEKTVLFAEPVFKFVVTPLRVNGLGVVRWDVTISAAQSGGPTKRILLEGYARAWEDEVVAVKPLSYRQTIQDSDVTERRMLVDHLPDDPLLSREQVIGQQAAREMRVGAVFNTRMVQPVPMVKTGQLVTITMTRGSFAVTSVGRAMEEGVFGQTIHVRNDETKETFDVTVTGQQMGRLE
jgi:flagella basal body P-ring formation protein FlgA